RDELHRVPLQAGAPHDVVDAHGVRVPQLRGELRRAPEALDDAEVGGERGMQYFDGHLTLEPQVARPEYPPEPPRADLVEQLVVVAEGAAQAALETDLGDLRRGGGLVESAGVAHEILEHLGRGEVAIARPGLE